MFRKIKEKLAQKKLEKRRHLEYLHSIPSAFDEAIFNWTAPEHTHYERGKIWKITAIAVSTLLIVLGVYLQVWTFSLAVLAFAIVYYLLHVRPEPKSRKVVISDVGVKFGLKKIPFSRVKAFWILYEPPYVKKLHLYVTGEMVNEIGIHLNDINPSLVREFLLEKIPELEGKKESFSEILLRLLKI